MRKKHLILFFALFVFFLSPQKVYGATLDIETFSDSALVPSLDGNIFKITIPTKFEHVTLERRNRKQGSLIDNTSYTDGVSMPSDRVIKFSADGYYTIRFFEFNGQSEFEAENLYFTITGLSDTGGSDGGGGSTPAPTPTFDDTAILQKLEKINSTIISNSYGAEISNKLSSLNGKVDSTNSKLDSTNSKLDTLNNVVSDISGKMTSVLNKMDTQIELAKDIKAITNTIKDELQTSQTIRKTILPNTKKSLDDNKPTQNKTSYKDTNEYFEDGGHKFNENAVMPQASEPEKWDGVEKPTDQIQDGELSQDEENSKEEELTKEEMAQDGELAKEEMAQDGELAKEEMAQDGELAKEQMAQDGELAKEEMAQDGELAKEEMAQDGELAKDEMTRNEKYEQNNQYYQNEFYKQTENDYDLRWKSEKGVFK